MTNHLETRRLLPALLVLLALGLSANSVFAGGASDTSPGAAKQDPLIEPIPPPEPLTQSTFPVENGLNLQINGQPTTIDGGDHNPLGVPLADTTNDKPAVGLAQVTGSYVDGDNATNPDGSAGVLVDGQHDDAQIDGGIVNNLQPKSSQIEQFILSVSNSATETVDLSGSSPTVTNLGSAISPVVVFAKASDITTENDLHLSGNLTGYGVLVVEINDPAMAQVVVSGGFKWVGLVMVVVNQRGLASEPKSPLDVTGGGNDNHFIGGVLVYSRNIPRTDGTGDGVIFENKMYQTRGQSDLLYSFEALATAIAKVKSSCRVRSWRKME